MSAICPWCGDPEVLEIADIWSGHEFMLETCCYARHEQVVAEMAEDPEWAVELLRHLGAEDLTGHRLRRLYDANFSPPVLDFKLDVRPVSFAVMQAFVGRFHRHCAPPVTWRFGAGIFNGWTQIGVLSVGNPVAIAYGNRGWVEVNRLCVRPDLAPQLAWNACSQLYGHAAREAERRGFQKIITYTRQPARGRMGLRRRSRRPQLEWQGTKAEYGRGIRSETPLVAVSQASERASAKIAATS